MNDSKLARLASMDSADAYTFRSFSGKPKTGRRRSMAVSIPNAVVPHDRSAAGAGGVPTPAAAPPADRADRRGRPGRRNAAAWNNGAT